MYALGELIIMSLNTKIHTLLYRMKFISQEEYFKKAILNTQSITYSECNKIWENPDIKVHTNIQDEAIQKMADHIKKIMDLQKNDVVLDVGAGDGLVDEKLKNAVKSYYGFDFSNQKIGEARKRNPECEYWQQSFLEPISLSEYVNKIFSNSVMQYCTPGDIKTFLKHQIETISSSKGGLIVHFDVPDQDRAYNYYSSFDRDIVDKYKKELKVIFSDGSYWHDMGKVKEVCKEYNCDVEIMPSSCKYRSDIIIHV